MAKPKVLAMVMAGGEGKRLYPLTKERAKPAVMFGGKYRLIDFVLSNLVNSEIHAIYVLTQFKAQSLMQHVIKGWCQENLAKDHFITIVPAQMRLGKDWYQGTADAVYQNLHLITSFAPDVVAVFSADHVYCKDVQQMLEFHLHSTADITIAAVPVKREQASAFGVIEVDRDGRVIGFAEKPASPRTLPHHPDYCLISMGNYLFNTDSLVTALWKDAHKATSHDFGKDIIPQLLNKRLSVYAYDFLHNRVPGVDSKRQGYWRDVGTIHSYWQANMDLKPTSSLFDLHNRKWPIHTVSEGDPPAKFICGASNSLVAEGSVIAGMVRDSIIGRNVNIQPGSRVENSIIFDHAQIGEKCRVRYAIVDKHAKIAAETDIGYDVIQDKNQGYHVDPSGIVVVPRPWLNIGAQEQKINYQRAMSIPPLCC